MRSSIIPITWPEDIDPNDLRRFESEARRLRFQGLGALSKDLGIKDILLAHHGDDQAETVMMRLMKGRWRSGLTGMKGIEGIPECHGMHGIHHSGGDVEHLPYLPYPIEAGGMRILRPLLGFEKSRLIATCNEHGINWAEDKTNHNPTYTSRNAIRHVLRNHKLPEAISSKSLISLAENMQKRLKSHKESADDVFNDTPLALDIQTGSLIVRFPLAAAFLDRPIETQKDKHDARNTAFLFLQRISELITPKEVPSIGQFSSVIDAIWPALALDPDVAPAESFSVYGTWFRRWNNYSPFTSIDYDFLAKNQMEWLLSRQPLISYEKKDGDISLTIPPVSRNPAAAEKWRLFDNRFWIKLKNYLVDDNLVIRTLEQDDLDMLSSHARDTSTKEVRAIGRNERFIRATLSLIKPVDLRRSIPAIFRKDSSGNETLLCLPTLGASRADPRIPIEDICQYEVRYKKCDFGSRDPEDIVVPALSFKNIRREVSRLDKEVSSSYSTANISLLLTRMTEIKKRQVEDSKEIWGRRFPRETISPIDYPS